MGNGQLVAQKICMTKDIGVNGNLFGGNMMAWMDEAAAIFAGNYTGERRLVTLKYAEILFQRPVRVGDLVEFYAHDPRLGRTSVTFDLEGVVTGEVVFRTTCTFVALDEDGRPKPIGRAEQGR